MNNHDDEARKQLRTGVKGGNVMRPLDEFTVTTTLSHTELVRRMCEAMSRIPSLKDCVVEIKPQPNIDPDFMRALRLNIAMKELGL